MSACQEWPAGTRVRCVDAGGNRRVVAGHNYTISASKGPVVFLHEVWGVWYIASRFKPIVRVKMGREIQPRAADTKAADYLSGKAGYRL